MSKVSAFKIHQAVRCLQQGGTIAYPTESIYGLGCDPFNPAAVARLLALKQRADHKGLILVTANRQQVQMLWPELSSEHLASLERSTLSKPITWLLPDEGESNIPAWIKGRHAFVAVRISAHTVVQQLCLAFGGAIVSTSANVSGFHPARSALQVRQQFQTGLDFVLTGALGGAEKPSQIRDIRDGTIVRD